MEPIFKSLLLVSLGLLLLGGSSHVKADASADKPLVIVNEEIKAPHLSLTVNGDVIEADYYEDDITGEEYTQERRDFDNSLFEAIEKMSDDVLVDIIEKHKNFLQLAGHAGSAKGLIGKYLPEYSKLVDSKEHGRPAKDEFLGDALSIWWRISEASAKEAATPLPSYEVHDEKGRLDKAATRKAQDEAKKVSEVKFMDDFHRMMRNLKATIASSPVGLYINFKTLTINGKTLIEVGTPFLTHLRRYNSMSIKLLNMIVGLLGHISL